MYVKADFPIIIIIITITSTILKGPGNNKNTMALIVNVKDI